MSYQYYRSIVVASSQVGGSDLVDFPILVRGTFAELKTTVNGGHIQNLDAGRPADLVFSPFTDGSSKYNHEIVSYNAVTGEIEAWVKIPALSASIDKTIYLCYGDAAIVTYQGLDDDTWDESAKGVWHLPDGTTLSTKNSVTGASGSGAAATAGQINGGALFNGTTDKISTDLVSSTPTALRTWSAWFKRTGGSAAGRIFNLGASSFQVGYNFFAVGAAGSQGNWSIDPPSDDEWHHIVVTYDANSAANDPIIYVDGSPVTVTNASRFTEPFDTTAQALVLGNRDANDRGFGGILDEVRISNNIRSAGWVTAEWNNQKPSSTFLTVNAEEEVTTTQYARPVETLSNTGWKRSSDDGSANLHTDIDEPSASPDAFFIYSTLGGVTEEVVVFRLGSLVGLIADGTTANELVFSWGKRDGVDWVADGQAVSATIELLPPVGDDTVIVSQGPTVLGLENPVALTIPIGTVLTSDHRVRITKHAA